MKRYARINSRSKTKHKPSVLRPNKFIRIPPAEYTALRLRVWERQNRRCGVEKCQRYVPFEFFGLDHEIMRSHGGKDVEENVLGKCQRCHEKRHGIKVIEH